MIFLGVNKALDFWLFIFSGYLFVFFFANQTLPFVLDFCVSFLPFNGKPIQ